MAEDIASLSDKIKLEVYNFTLDKNKVEEYKVDKIPAMVVCDGSGKDYGIRFYGIPAGYEFTSLIEAIRNVSAGESGLTEKSKQELIKLIKPVISGCRMFVVTLVLAIRRSVLLHNIGNTFKTA